MVNPGDYLPSDEEIDIEMFDSDTELCIAVNVSKRDGASRPPPGSFAVNDSESDFEVAAPPKRGRPAAGASKRGRGGRGRGRGRGRVAGASKAGSSEAEEEDAFDAPPKPKRGRPRKVVKEGEEKPKGTRGRKKKVANDDDDEFGKPKRGAAKGKARQITLDDIELPTREPVFDPAKNKELAEQYPDSYWNELSAAPGSQRIDYIDEEHPLELLPYALTDQMALTGMALSPDGTMLATFGSSGGVQIWDTETFTCLTTLRDGKEPNIDEFFVGQFLPNSEEYLVVGGKLKDRKRWSEADEDNHILPCPLKIFNVLTGEVVARLEGHSEEILCVKSVVYKGENYLVTTSQDGYIRCWHMGADWVVLLDTKEVADGVTCMAFTVSFVPNTGNRFFIASTDDHLTLMDLEHCKIVQRFDPIYSSYCDCGKFIEPVEEPIPEERRPVVAVDGADDGGAGPSSSASVTALPPGAQYAYFITRGVELLDAEDNTISSRPNTCTLHRLVYPTSESGKFELQEIRRYHHDEYLSNSWLIRIASNGRYLLAPTLNGQVFVFHVATGRVTGILRDHDTIEVRDCKFHPTKNLVFTCSDDGTVKVYQSTSRPKPAEDEATPTISQDSSMDVEPAKEKKVPESPKTAATSPLAALKDGIETMAVREIASADAAATEHQHGGTAE
ncbi:hypothetical protein GGF46_005140 [Coemansia sp. RSA 552]|nr:hypothetical protein GGF46_005140 [Coemansia sp. RSA 552]